LNVRRVVTEAPTVAEVFDNALDDIGPALRDLRPVGGDLLLRDAGDDLPGELVGAPAPEFAERGLHGDRDEGLGLLDEGGSDCLLPVREDLFDGFALLVGRHVSTLSRRARSNRA